MPVPNEFIRLDGSICKTTGVLLFTNDGELAKKLTHPSYEKKKVYHVQLDMDFRPEDLEKIKSGIELEDGFIAADDIQMIDPEYANQVGIEIHSGKKTASFAAFLITSAIMSKSLIG